jgi:hypothetical protein
MDIFWIIPIGTLGLACLGGFYAHIRKQPLSISTPRVLLDLPSTEQIPEHRDWSERPCGSYLEWLASQRK